MLGAQQIGFPEGGKNKSSSVVPFEFKTSEPYSVYKSVDEWQDGQPTGLIYSTLAEDTLITKNDVKEALFIQKVQTTFNGDYIDSISIDIQCSYDQINDDFSAGLYTGTVYSWGDPKTIVYDSGVRIPLIGKKEGSKLHGIEISISSNYNDHSYFYSGLVRGSYF